MKPGQGAGRPPLLRTAIKFLGAGLGNTLATIALYQLLVGPLGAKLAYALAWAAGIVLVVALYPRFVFGGRNSFGTGLRLGLTYAVVFLVGLGLTALFDHWDVPPRLTIFLVVAITATLNLAAGRWLVPADAAQGRRL